MYNVFQIFILGSDRASKEIKVQGRLNDSLHSSMVYDLVLVSTFLPWVSALVFLNNG